MQADQNQDRSIQSEKQVVENALSVIRDYAEGKEVQNELLSARKYIYGDGFSRQYAGRLINVLYTWANGEFDLATSDRGQHKAYLALFNSLGLTDERFGGLRRGTKTALLDLIERGESGPKGIPYRVGDAAFRVSKGDAEEEMRRYDHGDQEFVCVTRQDSLGWKLNDHSAIFHTQVSETDNARVQEELSEAMNGAFGEYPQDVEELLYETAPNGALDPLLLMKEKGLRIVGA